MKFFLPGNSFQVLLLYVPWLYGCMAIWLYGVVLPMNLFCFILLLSFSLPHNPHTSVDSWALVIFLIAFFFPHPTAEECGCPATHIDEMAGITNKTMWGKLEGCWASRAAGLMGLMGWQGGVSAWHMTNKFVNKCGVRCVVLRGVAGKRQTRGIPCQQDTSNDDSWALIFVH